MPLYIYQYMHRHYHAFSSANSTGPLPDPHLDPHQTLTWAGPPPELFSWPLTPWLASTCPLLPLGFPQGRSKKDARQVSAAAALEFLLQTVPPLEFQVSKAGITSRGGTGRAGVSQHVCLRIDTREHQCAPVAPCIS